MTKRVTCPTCGCPVKVGGEGKTDGSTHYYIPILPPEVERLVQAAILALEELKQSPCRDHPSHAYCMKCRAQGELAEALAALKGK